MGTHETVGDSRTTVVMLSPCVLGGFLRESGGLATTPLGSATAPSGGSGGHAATPPATGPPAGLKGFNMQVLVARATQGHSVPTVVASKLGGALASDHLSRLGPVVYHLTTEQGVEGIRRSGVRSSDSQKRKG